MRRATKMLLGAAALAWAAASLSQITTNLGADTVLYLPDGTTVSVPAGTKFDACGRVVYRLRDKLLDICPLFSDGFE